MIVCIYSDVVSFYTLYSFSVRKKFSFFTGYYCGTYKTLTIKSSISYTYFCSKVVLSKDIILNVGGLIFNNNVTYVNHTFVIRDICYEYDKERISFANDMKSFEADMDALKNDIIAFRNFLIKLWIGCTMFLVASTW